MSAINQFTFYLLTKQYHSLIFDVVRTTQRWRTSLGPADWFYHKRQRHLAQSTRKGIIKRGMQQGSRTSMAACNL